MTKAIPDTHRRLTWADVVEERDAALGRAAQNTNYTPEDAKHSFFPLALGAIETGNLTFLKQVLTQHPCVNDSINHYESGHYEPYNKPARSTLMTAIFFSKHLVPLKLLMAHALLDHGFTAVDKGYYCMGVSSSSAFVATCSPWAVKGIMPDDHRKLIRRFLKVGGYAFAKIQPLSSFAYEKAQAHYPYLLKGQGGCIPKPRRRKEWWMFPDKMAAFNKAFWEARRKHNPLHGY